MEFSSYGLTGGLWSGRLIAEAPPGRVVLLHQGRVIAEAALTPEEGGWMVSVSLPASVLTDGVQSLLLMAEDAQGGASQQLDCLHLAAGTALDADIAAEIGLIRAELDLLKREFRRFAASD